MSASHNSLLEKPVVSEGEIIDGVDVIVYDNLGPEGATVVVEYEGIQSGDRVQLWEGSEAPYNETKIVSDGATSLIFMVPKEYLREKRWVSFLYVVLADDDSPIAASYEASYTVTRRLRKMLPAPVIREAVPSRGLPYAETIVIADLPVDGATLVVNYPDIKMGDRIKALLGEYEETKEVLGAIPVLFKVPKAYYEQVGAVVSHQFALVDERGDSIVLSKMQMYFIE